MNVVCHFCKFITNVSLRRICGLYPGHWAELLCEREICLGIKCELTSRERWADLYDSSLLRMKTDEK